MNGPVSFEELVNLINAGVVTQKTFVWQTGHMRQMAGEIEELTPYFQFDSQPVEQNVDQSPKPIPQPESISLLQGQVDMTKQAPKKQEKTSGGLVNTFCESTGVGNMDGFSLSALFSETLSKHTAEELEMYFGVGTPLTTPPINKVNVAWPKPWMFVRLIVLGLVGYFLFKIQLSSNLKSYPGAIFFGSFVIPFACLMFFFECNILKNISFYQVTKLFLYGGMFGLFFTIWGSILLSPLYIPFELILGASSAGLMEEPAKLLVLILLLKFGSLKHKNYILNGLLFGAAVGAGFAAFETAGYAFEAFLLDNRDVQSAIDSLQKTLYIRGVLAPFGHIIWTAMCAGALWRVKKNQDFKISMLFNPLFLTVFTIAVVLHISWNSEFMSIASNGWHFYILGIIGWIIIFGLIGMGLRQVRQQQQYLAAKEAQKQQAG